MNLDKQRVEIDPIEQHDTTVSSTVRTPSKLQASIEMDVIKHQQQEFYATQQKMEKTLLDLKQDVLRMHNTLLLIHADMAVLLNPHIYNQPTKYDSSREMITGIIEHDSSSGMWDGIIEHNG